MCTAVDLLQIVITDTEIYLHIVGTNLLEVYIQGVSNMTGTYAACLHRNQSRSYLNHPVFLIRQIKYLFF